MFQSILVATDGSQSAARAVDLAVRLAHRHEAGLIIVNVISDWDVPDDLYQMAEVEHLIDRPSDSDKPLNVGTFGSLNRENRFRVAEAVSKRILERASEAASHWGVSRIETLSLEGPPAEAIIEQVRGSGAELVVVGTRGLGRLNEMILGSVSHKISVNASCPCLITH